MKDVCMYESRVGVDSKWVVWVCKRGKRRGGGSCLI